MNTVARGRDGFTLLEILVALVLIGLLVGTLVPSVINQISRGEVSRVAEDLGAVGNSTKAFRVDVQRWPGDLEDLVSRPGTGDTIPGTTSEYPAGLASRWAGPYLEYGTLKGDSLPSAMGGVIRNRFATKSWGAESFLVVKMSGINASNAQAVSLVVDGDTVVADSDAGGRVRWITGDTLLYLAAPMQ